MFNTSRNKIRVSTLRYTYVYCTKYTGRYTPYVLEPKKLNETKIKYTCTSFVDKVVYKRV